MRYIDRRKFIQQSLGTAAAVLAGPPILRAAASASAAAIPQPCAPAAWQKHGIVIEATEEWEGGQIQNFTSPPEPLGGNRWRFWYTPCGKNQTIACAEGIAGEPLKKFPAQCTPGDAGDGPFALGHLPDKWKPVQVVHIHLKNGKHRIYFWAHGPGICRYLAADSDDGKRYTVVDPLRPVLYHPNDRAAHGVPSPDGVMLSKKPSKDRPADEPNAIPRLISNDATNIYQLPNGSFEMYSVALVSVPKDDPAYMPHDNAPGLLRVIDRYTSADGLHFEERQRVIQRDAQDPVDQQFYYLAVTYTPKGLVGMLGHYRCQAQTMDLEWCFSPDGATWHRPQRKAWLPRGDEKQPDSYGIYAPSFLVQRGAKWHLFYTGVNSAHNGKHSYGPARDLVLYATAPSIWA
jgi:hypothetical protein